MAADYRYSKENHSASFQKKKKNPFKLIRGIRLQSDQESLSFPGNWVSTGSPEISF